MTVTIRRHRDIEIGAEAEITACKTVDTKCPGRMSPFMLHG
jgi:hypothetical protein